MNKIKMVYKCNFYEIIIGSISTININIKERLKK